MKKGSKLFYFAISLVVLIVAIFAVNAAVNNKASIGWEPASNVTIKIGTSNKLLTDTNSLIGDSLVSSSLSVDSGTAPISGHNADEIWVSVSGQEMTLRQARATEGLCGTPSSVNSYSSKPATLQYHYATQIEMPSGKNLQEEINAGEVLYTKNYARTCATDNKYYYKDSCSRQGNLIEDCNVVPACTGGTVSCVDDSSGIYRQTSEQTCYRGSCDVIIGCSETPYTSSALRKELTSASYHRYWYGTDTNRYTDGTIYWAITDTYCGIGDVDDKFFKNCVPDHTIFGEIPVGPLGLYCGWPINNGAYYPACANIGGVYCKRFNYGENLEYCGAGGLDGTWADYACNSEYDSSCNIKSCPPPLSIRPPRIPGVGSI